MLSIFIRPMLRRRAPPAALAFKPSPAGVIAIAADRSVPALANRRQKPRDGALPVVALKDLSRSAIAFRLADGVNTGTISVERGAAGKVVMVCQCGDCLADGWCRHCIDLLCLRYDGLQGADAPARQAMAGIVAGTRAASAGSDADRALKAFDACLKRFDEARPQKVRGRNLSQFTDLVSDLAACAAELEDALSKLQRLLERD